MAARAPVTAAAQKKPQGPDVDLTWMRKDTFVWVEVLDTKPDDEAFKKGKIVSVEASSQNVTINYDNNKQEVVKAFRVLERADFGDTYQKGFDDMVNMEILNDAELMENVRKRFMCDKIQTYVGPTLLVVNPFKKIDGGVGPEVREKYILHIVPAKGNPLAYKELPPHVYALAAEAFRSLFDNDKNQSIVISGESGAGKTENAKFAMSLLTSIGQYDLETGKMIKQIEQQKEDISIEDKILSCNPILEAFGNSKTKRNNNSSRFGKYVRMIVEKTTKKIQGADIVNYLLEKSRLTQQGLDERNFHIFYHLLEGSTEEELKKLFLVDKTDKKIPYPWFEYLNKSKNYVSPGINDKELFLEIQQSFRALGMRAEESSIFRIVAAVLLFGNVVFDGSTFGNNTPCSFADKTIITNIAHLLELEPSKLMEAMTLKIIKVGGQNIVSPINLVECLASRDSLAKEIYERLFNWMVQKLNLTIQPQDKGDYLCIGLLDIYGFEVFEMNTFEQLMINYTNEKLHQLYILYVFKEEERVFVNEGLAEYCCQIKFADNTPVIDLLEKPPTGIFNMLDESCSIASQTDDNFLTNLRTKHKTNPFMQQPKQPTKKTFTIVHTAKDVEYATDGFRAKNKDETSVMLLEALSNSRNALITQMFEKNAPKGDKYIGTKIRKEMAELMRELNSCDVHFIRCLKPNELKKSNVFHQANTLNQIRYLGVLDSLKVRKESYPVRRTFQAFYKAFGDMGKDEPYPILLNKGVDFKYYTDRLVAQYFSKMSPEQFLCGKTKIFMRQPGALEVQKIYNEECDKKHKKATKIQRLRRCYVFRKKIEKFLKKIALWKARLMGWLYWFRYNKMKRSTVKIQRWVRLMLMKIKRKNLLSTAKLLQKYIKRAQNIAIWETTQKGIIIIQKNIRRYLCGKILRKMKCVKAAFLLALERAFTQIINSHASKIQTAYRGWYARAKILGIDDAKKIKEAGRQERIRQKATLITRWVRGCVTRMRISRWNSCAAKIQGFMRMKWFSQFFKLMREKAIIIQRHARTYIYKKRAFREKYQEFVQDWETNYVQSQSQESDQLFGPSLTSSNEDNQQKSQTQIKKSEQKQTKLTSQRQLIEKNPQKIQINNQQYNSVQTNRSFQMTNENQLSQRQISSERNTLRSFQNNNTQRNNNQIKQQISNRQNPPTTRKWLGIENLETQDQQGQNQPQNQVQTQFVEEEINPQISESQKNSEPIIQEGLQSIDAILLKNFQQQLLVNRMGIFTLVFDMEIFCDMTDIYPESWTITYKTIMSQMFTRNLPLQQIQIGETHTTVVSVSGRAFAWGENDFGQLGNDVDNLIITPIQIPLPIDFKIKQLTTGDLHTIALGYDGTIWTWGNQYGTNQTPKPINIELISSINSKGFQSFAVSQTGQLYSWLNNNEPQKIILFKGKVQVSQVSCGNQFTLILMQNGSLMAYGENQHGELGLGDNKPRSEPTLVEKLTKYSEKVQQISAGFKHVIVKSNSGRIFTWGWGEMGQLGHGLTSNENSPKLLQLQQKVLQVCAGHKCTLILFENHIIKWCGTNKSIQKESKLIEISLESRSAHLASGQYLPLKIITSWSRTISLIQITFVGLKDPLIENQPLKLRLMNSLVQKWVEQGIYNIDPPLIDQLAPYIQEKHMKKPNAKMPQQVGITKEKITPMQQKIQDDLNEKNESIKYLQQQIFQILNKETQMNEIKK